MIYKVELVERKHSIEQLEASKSSIKDLFSDILNKTKGFEYQITLTITLEKYKPNREIEFRPVYFNSTTKTVINHKYGLANLLNKFCKGLIAGLTKDDWIVELIQSQCINISIYRPLSWHSYLKLPVELRRSKKD